MQHKSPYPMVSVDEAQRLITAQVTPIGVEEVDILGESADGRVLAEDVYGVEPLPDMPKAAVDGYAVRSTDGDAPRRVVAEVTAGSDAGVTRRSGDCHAHHDRRSDSGGRRRCDHGRAD